MNTKQIQPVLCLMAILFGCSTQKSDETNMLYPPTETIAHTDTYFDKQVPDPYRWLEDDTSAQTNEWVKKQNAVTFGYLDNIPFRKLIREKIEATNNFERIGIPELEGKDLYYSKNDGLQNQNVYYRLAGGSLIPELFLDPNTFSKDGTTGLDRIYFSHDGSIAAYLITEGGSDWRKAIVINPSTKTILEDTLADLKFTTIAWAGNEGFYYSSYEKPSGSELSAKTQNHRLMYHRLHTPQKEDKLIFGGEQLQRRYVGGTVTEDQRYLIITAANSTTGNELYVQDRLNNGNLITVAGNFENNHTVLDNTGDHLIIYTNYKAPNGRIVSADLLNPAPENWKDLIPETANSIEAVSTAGRNIFVNYLKDASTLIRQYDYNGRPVRDIALPGLGTATGFEGKQSHTEVYYSFASFTRPSSIYRYDIASGKSTLYAEPKLSFSPDDFETKQVFYESKDGTKIPMFIVHKKGLELNGRNPTILYGYGGFNVNLTPVFSAARIVWMENGGVFAQPNLRGGGEYGEEWHLAGTKMKKQNVFDDFIAAGEYLFREKYTSGQYLALSGGSNGGLLVGATMTQRPELARVALPDVGVLDMLRYHTFTAGAGWAYDYGTAEDSKEMFEYLLRYSPVHAVKPGVSYPATLVTTADHDDRVVPAHSFKFAATLQANHAGSTPVLIRIDTKSGHGASNLSKAIEKVADQYAFSWYNMGVVPPLAKKEM